MGQPVSPVRPKVLVIDDDESIHEGYSAHLAAHVQMLSAQTLTEGDALFMMNPDLSAVVFDGNVQAAVEDTCALVQRYRMARPNLLLIAASATDNKALLAAGCTHATAKFNLPRLLFSLLNIPLE